MIKTLACLAFCMAVIVMLFGTMELLAKQWEVAHYHFRNAGPWLLCGIGGVLIEIRRAQQVALDERRRQHAELMAALRR